LHPKRPPRPRSGRLEFVQHKRNIKEDIKGE
jgi:hypothetical protein